MHDLPAQLRELAVGAGIRYDHGGLLGHRSVQTTARYAHLAMTAEASDGLGRLIRSVLKAYAARNRPR